MKLKLKLLYYDENLVMHAIQENLYLILTPGYFENNFQMFLI